VRTSCIKNAGTDTTKSLNVTRGTGKLWLNCKTIRFKLVYTLIRVVTIVVESSSWQLMSDLTLLGWQQLVNIRDAPDNLKAGYRISGRISSAGRIPDIQPDFQLNIEMSKDIRCRY
jgi:hypothetical protein